jgi:hypothetical protein
MLRCDFGRVSQDVSKEHTAFISKVYSTKNEFRIWDNDISGC